MRTGRFIETGVAEVIEPDVETGRRENTKNNPMLFTTAYFHKPDELTLEIAACGFGDVRAIAIEGPILITRNLEDHWADEQSRALLLQFAAQVESEPAILGMRNHIAMVGYKK